MSRRRSGASGRFRLSRKGRLIAIVLATAVAAVALPLAALPAAANIDPSVAERISGPDRYATSLQAARAFAAVRVEGRQALPVVASELSVDVGG